MTETLDTERDGRVLVVRLDNRPLGLIDRRLVAELTATVLALRRDRSIGAVVLTGARPGHFVTHYDIDQMLAGSERVGMTMPVPAAGLAARTITTVAKLPGAHAALARSPFAGVLDLAATGTLFGLIERLDKVVIAAINGPALGAACELVLACDLRYMASDAGAIGTPELTQGYGPGAGGSQRHARAYGQARALELVLEARTPTPAEALALGLVHRVIEPERLLDEALATAHRLARRAPLSVAAVKRAVQEGSRRPLAAGLAAERGWFMAALSRPAARQAMRRYVDDLQRDGHGPWEREQTYAAWREGTAVDLAG